MATFYVHAPAEKLHYEVAWGDVIGDGVSITTSTFAVSPTGPTISGAGIDVTTTYFDIVGCTVGEDYVITNVIVLDNGETYSSSVFLFAEAK